jgi:hypothetical protein
MASWQVGRPSPRTFWKSGMAPSASPTGHPLCKNCISTCDTASWASVAMCRSAPMALDLTRRASSEIFTGEKLGCTCAPSFIGCSPRDASTIEGRPMAGCHGKSIVLYRAGTPTVGCVSSQAPRMVPDAPPPNASSECLKYSMVATSIDNVSWANLCTIEACAQGKRSINRSLYGSVVI